MTKHEDLRLHGSTGSKTGGYEREKGDEKRAHRGSRHDLTNDRNSSVFRVDGVFGNHRVFPSKKAACEHLTTVAKQFRQARRLAGLPESLKLYGARHAFATYAVEATGNLFAVADAMGHEDLKSTRIYQHPEFAAIRDAIDQRNNRRVM